MKKKITTSHLRRLVKEEINMSRRTQRRQTTLLNEKMSLKDFKPDGSQDVMVMGVAGATIPNSNVKEGDIIKVDMVIYGGKPMGRYRKFDLESIRDFRKQNPMRGKSAPIMNEMNGSKIYL